MEEKLLNIGEVAVYLNMSEEAVRELVQKGDLPAYKIGGALLRFKKEQIEGFRRGVKPVRIKPMEAAGVKYTFWEALEDFLYYNDFYILSFIILVLILLAVFGF